MWPVAAAARPVRSGAGGRGGGGEAFGPNRVILMIFLNLPLTLLFLQGPKGICMFFCTGWRPLYWCWRSCITLFHVLAKLQSSDKLCYLLN